MSVPPQNGTLVVVGGGLAGAKTVEAARAQGFEGTVVLIGDEAELPYERPPLSKEYLRGESEFEAQVVHGDAWYASHVVDLRRGEPVSALHPTDREVELAGGERVGYDALVLATGSEPRRPDTPGADADGVQLLRTKADADALRPRLREGAHVVVVGGGWIGLEVAASARSRGAHASVVLRGRLPLEKVLGPVLGEYYAGVHRAHGTDIVTGRTVSEVLTTGGRVRGVRLDDGRELPADTVVFGLGATPRTALAAEAGLAVAPDGGLLVDAQLRTSDERIWAVGDIAAEDHPRWGRLRVEHWDNALHQPEAAMRSIMGCNGVYDRQPYFFSDQYDVGMEYVGHVADPARTEVVIRGELGRGEFVAFWVDGEDRLLAAMNVNVWDVVDEIMPLIRPVLRVDRDRLADPDVPYGDVVITD